MLSTLKNFASGALDFVSRHRRKFAVGAVVVAVAGGIYYWRSTSAQNQIEHSRKMGYIQRMQRFFKRNRQAADDALRKIIPETKKILLQLLNCEQLAVSFKDQQRSPEEQKALWDQLKIDSITRLLTALYSTCLIDLFFSIQLNQIGRIILQNFLQEEEQKRSRHTAATTSSSSSSPSQQQQPDDTSSVPTNNNSEGGGDDDEDPILTRNVQRDFFAYSYYFHTHGIIEMTKRIRHYVEQYFGPIPIKNKNITSSEMNQIMAMVCHDFEQELAQSFNNTSTTASTNLLCAIMLPPEQTDTPSSSNSTATTTTSSSSSSTNTGNTTSTPTTATMSKQQQQQDIIKQLLNELRDMLESKSILPVLNNLSTSALKILNDHVDKMVIQAHRKSALSKTPSTPSTPSTTTTTTTTLDDAPLTPLSATSTNTPLGTDSSVNSMFPTSATSIAISTNLGAILSRLIAESKVVLHSGPENEYLRAIHDNPEFVDYCAKVYSMGVEL